MTNIVPALRNVHGIISRCGSRLAGALQRCPSHGVASYTAFRAPCPASRQACPHREVTPCTFLSRLVLLAAFGVLAACGGGGGSPGTGTSARAVAVPIDIAMRNLVMNGYSATLIVSGNINGAPATGSGTSNWTPAVPSTFENKLAVDAVAVDNLTITAAGITQFIPSITHQYFSAASAPLGEIDVVTREYTVVTSFSGWPFSAREGDSGTLGSSTIFNDAGKGAVVGRERLSYAIEPDTANSAVLVLVSVRNDNANNVVLKTFERYRVTVDGSVLPLSTRGIVSEPGLIADLTLTVTSVSPPAATSVPRRFPEKNSPFFAAQTGALQRCSSLVWPATRRSSRLASPPVCTTPMANSFPESA